MGQNSINLPDSYGTLLQDLKERIQNAQLKAAVAVNRELILLYWDLGARIIAQQNEEGWGTKVIDRLAGDLHGAFPSMKGLSPRNLKYMRAFAQAWPDVSIVQAALAQLPWYHNIALIEKLDRPDERLWYAQQAIQNGWSRNVLVHQIESQQYYRHGKAITNFSRTLPPPQSELAQQLIKDPYDFDFLMLGPDMLERDLERGLIEHLRDLILELGKGFAFVGSQYHVEVGDQDYYLDLIFYHLRLRCFVVFDLKIEDFKPEFAGKMNFYLSAVDDLLRHHNDQPSIGVILCKGRNEIVVEYALRDTTKPMGVAQYQLTTALPDQLKNELPSAGDLAREFPLFSLLKLRIEIERALHVRAKSLGLTENYLGMKQLIEWLRQRNASPSGADNFLRVVSVLNYAAHGRDVDGDGAQEAMRVGMLFLESLQE
jgi:predicted nuclease of restriction endonuclease-like (RecB) superfamily